MWRAVPLVLVLGLCAGQKPVVSAPSPESLFKEFETKFEKVYESVEERLKRMAIFAENLLEIERMNLADPGAQYSHLTPFADWTQQEFLAQNKLRADLWDSENTHHQAPELPVDDLPGSFDWREKGAVNEVKNQGQCGSCWAFATVGNIEGVNFLKTGKLLSLSEQELVDCDKKTGNEGCQGGLPLNAYKDMVDNKIGLEAESDYPYAADDTKCAATQAKEKVFISNYTHVSTNETQIAAALVKYGPLAIGINAGPMQFYFGGIASPWKILCNPKSLDHGVVLVGYGTGSTILHGERDYWVIRNSWGPSWGEKGYYRIIRNTGACGLNNMVTTAFMGDVEEADSSSTGSIVV